MEKAPDLQGYFEHPYPEGYKSYSKSKPMRAQEFDLEREWWNNREENEYAWKVTIDKIKERNYNLDFKNPNNVELGINHSTAEVLDLLENDNRKFDLLIEEIKTVL